MCVEDERVMSETYETGICYVIVIIPGIDGVNSLGINLGAETQNANVIDLGD
jgi:hypothetical protein